MILTCRFQAQQATELRRSFSPAQSQFSLGLPIYRDNFSHQSCLPDRDGPVSVLAHQVTMRFPDTVVISSESSSDSSTPSSHLDFLDDISQSLLMLDTNHIKHLEQNRLLRPPTLTPLWPSLLVLPPLSLYVYANYTSWVPAIVQLATDAKDTMRGFVEGWLIEPLVGVLRTVRTGDAGDVLVHEAGVIADVQASRTSCLQHQIRS